MKNPGKGESKKLTDAEKARLEEMVDLISTRVFKPDSVESYARSLREALGKSPDLALALVTRLGDIKSRVSAQVLREIADLFTHKKYKKAVRQAEYRMKSAGLLEEEEEEEPQEPGPRYLVKTRESLKPCAWASRMDSSGTQALMVILPSGGGHRIALFAVDGRAGVKNLENAEAASADAEKVLSNFCREKGLEAREVPLEHAAHAVEFAIRVTREEERPLPGGAQEVSDRLRELLEGPPESCARGLLDECGRDPRELLKDSQKLADWEQFNTYLFPQKLISPVAQRLKGLEESSIILTEGSQKRIGAELTGDAAAAVFTGEVKRDLVFRLEETAFHLHLCGENEDCLVALAAARDITEGPSELNLFARALLERSLEALGVKLEQEAADRGEGLIEMP